MNTYLRMYEREARVYKGVWRGSVFSSFVNPFLYLIAMGMFLGRLVDEQTGGVAGVTYLEFLAPGLLAATAMQAGAGDSAWPVLAGIKWQKTYVAALASPLRSRDIVIGHLAWVATRVALVSVIYVLVAALLGATGLASGLLAVIPAVLTGLAFAGLVSWFSATLEDGIGLTNLFRFGIMPLFLFSGTFFEISRLPDWMEPIAYITPLWHGVELTRAVALGTEPPLGRLGHAAVLVGVIVVGTALAARQFEKRLVV
ncbi:MAG: ABC transporter permease [Acidimicrobiia bacterium]|nr:ABC transporter permease [Acidimicrobiia bacterium]MDH5421343.1 ABC transporter permease [Acidimicrobiia bacterium]MDH5503410.1 ABC transporter permease [Acidimicrobiia bacterium]